MRSPSMVCVDGYAPKTGATAFASPRHAIYEVLLELAGALGATAVWGAVAAVLMYVPCALLADGELRVELSRLARARRQSQ